MFQGQGVPRNRRQGPRRTLLVQQGGVAQLVQERCDFLQQFAPQGVGIGVPGFTDTPGAGSVGPNGFNSVIIIIIIRPTVLANALRKKAHIVHFQDKLYDALHHFIGMPNQIFVADQQDGHRRCLCQPVLMKALPNDNFAARHAVKFGRHGLLLPDSQGRGMTLRGE